MIVPCCYRCKNVIWRTITPHLQEITLYCYLPQLSLFDVRKYVCARETLTNLYSSARPLGGKIRGNTNKLGS